ncbi:hypothetical protein [Paenibacillus lautus]|uniref:JAB domain-containing protein n=1 Tax=Paenibacillus lautus TaxID=1401 RepID=A0A385TVU7_PAELA|nr:hypothetical protein [Paenibacillus lautus]AYB47999.1 hypothetical protein D5F53_32225 [Paenibacillus lautus]
MANDFFGQSDLFSYFGGNFVDPLQQNDEKNGIQAEGSSEKGTTGLTESKESDLPSSTVPAPAENNQSIKNSSKLISLEQHRGKEGREKESSPAPDACTDANNSVASAGNNDTLDEEEREALKEEGEEEREADMRELAGESGNTSIPKSDIKTPSNATKKEVKKPVFNHTTFICYSGLNLSITKFFSVDKLATLELEEVRKRLEKDYPELSKQRTKMEWDEKKNIIVPMVTGGKKGAYFINGTRGFYSSAKELIEHQEPISYLAAQDGYYEIRENPIGVFIGKSSFEELCYWEGFEEFDAELPKSEYRELCRSGFKFKLPRIPTQLLAQLVSFFMDYTEYNVEVMGVFYFDIVHERYILDVPYQRVTKTSIDPNYTFFPAHMIKVAEIHSHNTMLADFSSIDDNDEVGTMLYGVIGKIHRGQAGKVFFDIRTRAGLAGKFIPLDPQVFIEGDLRSHRFNNRMDFIEYPNDWVNKVKFV